MIDGSGLEDVYGATIERIKAQGGDRSRLGIGALMWICHAEWPLSPDELCHCLGIELGSTDFNASNIPSITTLLACCQGLIMVDKEESTVRLIHFTLREYLSACSNIFNRPHSAMAEICLTYLNSQVVKALWSHSSTHLDTLIDDKPFLEYCLYFWGVHAKKELSNNARTLSMELFGQYDDSRSLESILKIDRSCPEDFPPDSLWSGLHCASFFGLVEVVADLIYMGCYDLDEAAYGGATALSLAAGEGHEEVVRMLLGHQEVTPDKSDELDMTPLAYAAWRGHEGVVGILLGREDVNPNNPDEGGMTPLMLAAMHGHEGVVKMLLRREEVNPDKQDNSSRTPLWHAVRHGHEGVVEILLRQVAVNPNKADREGQTPLMLASTRGHKGVIALLESYETVTHSTI